MTQIKTKYFLQEANLIVKGYDEEYPNIDYKEMFLSMTNRRNIKLFTMNNLFKDEILSRCTNEKIEDQILCLYDKVTIITDDSEIIKELDIQQISADKVIRRLITLSGKCKRFTFMGFCYNFMIGMSYNVITDQFDVIASPITNHRGCYGSRILTDFLE